MFGKRAGTFAARFARDNGGGRIDEDQVQRTAGKCLEPFERSGTDGPYVIQKELQQMMQNLVGIVRVEQEMREALSAILSLRERAQQVSVEGNREYNPGWHTALDLENLLIAAEAVTRAALERKESRGAQFREDYPSKDEAAGKFNIVLRRLGEEMEVRREPIPEMRPDLRRIIEEMG